MAIATAAGALPFVWADASARDAANARLLADARRTAELAARGAAAVRDLPRAADRLLDDQTLLEGALLGLIAEQQLAARATPRAIQDRLRQIADATVLDEVSVRTGRAAAGEAPDAEASSLRLTGGTTVSALPAVRQEAGGAVVKRGTVVSGDGTRAVSFTLDASRLDELSRRAGLENLVDDLIGTRTAEAVWVLGTDRRELARGALLGGGRTATRTPDDDALVGEALAGRAAVVRPAGSGLAAAAPVLVGTDPIAAVLLRLPLAPLPAGVPTLPLIAAILAGGVLAAFAAALLLREAVSAQEPADRMAEAAALLQARRFNPFAINDLCDRNDGYGRLARAFRAMAFEVTAREEALEARLDLQAAYDTHDEDPPPAAPPT